jgi:hypothetical protein
MKRREVIMTEPAAETWLMELCLAGVESIDGWTWHLLGQGDFGDPTSLLEGPDGEVFTVQELWGCW